MTTNFSKTAAYIWSLADLLRGDFKQSQYGRVILPFTILRRLECVLESSKSEILEQVEKLKAMTKLEEDAREKFLLRAAGQSFYNTSPMDLSKLGSSDIKSNLLTHKDKNGQYFTMMLYPPADLKSLERQPVELIFVLDCSGSMRGQPLNQAKAAVRQGLGRLNPQDTFQIIRFSNNASQLGPRPLKATEENIQRGLNYLSQLRGSGGTMMIEGIKAALDFAHDENHLRFVCFLTDGLLGNDAQIIGEVHKRISNSRIFSFGVGSAPNRYLMNRMAKLGRGAVSYLSLKDDVAKVMDKFFDSISHPALTDIKINWGAMKVKDVYPARIPDLFAGQIGRAHV